MCVRACACVLLDHAQAARDEAMRGDLITGGISDAVNYTVWVTKTTAKTALALAVLYGALELWNG